MLRTRIHSQAKKTLQDFRCRGWNALYIAVLYPGTVQKIEGTKVSELARQASSVLADLKRDGFSLRLGLAPHSSTTEVAQALGSVTNLEEERRKRRPE